MAPPRVSRRVPPPLATRWRPGQSGNPKGRPPKDFSVTSGLKLLEERLAPTAYRALFDRHQIPPRERTYGMLRALLTVALATKNPAALKEWAERVEGKVVQPVGGLDGGEPLMAAVQFYLPDNGRDGEAPRP